MAKDRTDHKCFEAGLNCVKLLSPNKPINEPTPHLYAAYPAPSGHAIRTPAPAGVVSADRIGYRSAQHTVEVAHLLLWHQYIAAARNGATAESLASCRAESHLVPPHDIY